MRCTIVVGCKIVNSVTVGDGTQLPGGVIVGVGNGRKPVADAIQIVGIRIGIDGGVAFGVHRSKDLPRQAVVGGVGIGVSHRAAGSAGGCIRIRCAGIRQNVIHAAGVIGVSRETSP